MKVNILETGSAGNCVVASFSEKMKINGKELAENPEAEPKWDYKKVIFDFGHNAYDLCLQRYKDKEYVINWITVDDILITHSHLDHCADYPKMRNYAFPKEYKVFTFPVVHNVENRGFVVLNEKMREGFIYATDYSEIPTESLEKIKAFVAFKDWRWFAMLELSFVRWIYEKLDATQMIGLNHHCAYETFCHYADEILAVNPAVNILTLHASARQGKYIEGENKTGDVCPPDYVREQLWKKYGKKGFSVRFGEAGGMCGNYNYIDKN